MVDAAGAPRAGGGAGPPWLAPVGDADADPQAAAALAAARERRGGGPVTGLLRVLARSPAALDGYLSLDAALARGALGLAARERIALAVSAANGCAPCLAQHRAVAGGRAGLDPAEVARAEAGGSDDRRAAAAVGLALAFLRSGSAGAGGATPADPGVLAVAVDAARAAGLAGSEALEAVAAAFQAALANAVHALAAAGAAAGDESAAP